VQPHIELTQFGDMGQATFSWGPTGKEIPGRAVFFASVSDNHLWTAVQRVAQSFGATCVYEEPCFLFMQEECGVEKSALKAATASSDSVSRQHGAIGAGSRWLSPLSEGLRPLRLEDAELVDSKWTYSLCARWLALRGEAAALTAAWRQRSARLWASSTRAG
jgi:hypothetical protein